MKKVYKRLYKKLYKRCASILFIIVAAFGLMFIFTEKTAENTQVTENDAVNEAVYAQYQKPAVAVVIPNNLEFTFMSERMELQYDVSPYKDKVVAYVDDFLPIRTEATRDSETIGKMYPGCIADVIERGEVWSKIRSGDIEGYIQNIYVCFDSEAEDLAIILGGEDSLRTAISIEEEAAQAAEEARIKAEKEAARKAAEEAAKKAAEEAAKKAAEEAAKKAAEEAAKKAAEEAAKEEAKKTEEETEGQAAQGSEEVQSEPQTEAATEAPTVSPYYMELSQEDIYLIACIVDWEANAEVYEGKLAVANVVLNRVRSSAFPNTVSGVIYQRSQFSGVLDSAGNYSARWQARLASGPRNQECYQAAIDAAAGVNNVIGYMSFNGTVYCNLSSFKSYIIIGNHCFYQR